MKPRTIIQLVAAVVVVVFAIGIWSTGGQLNPGWLRFFSIAVVVASAGWALCEHTIWKTPLAQRFRSVPRNVGGTWKGTLTSFWKDPATGEVRPPKPAYLVIRQTASTVSAILLTDESRSASSLGTVSGSDGSAWLDYMYLNHPDARFEEGSRMHHGSSSLLITGHPANRLKGRYWTDRDTRGELDFTERSKQTAENYDEATALFAEPG